MDIGNRSKVTGVYVLLDKAVELVVLRLCKMNARQTHDLIVCIVVAQFGSLQGLVYGISLVADSLVS
jgi:hypothetical protein